MGYIIRDMIAERDETTGSHKSKNRLNADGDLMVFDTKELAEAHIKDSVADQWNNIRLNGQWVWQRNSEVIDESDKDNHLIWIEKLDGTMAIHVWENNTWVERV